MGVLLCILGFSCCCAIVGICCVMASARSDKRAAEIHEDDSNKSKIAL